MTRACFLPSAALSVAAAAPDGGVDEVESRPDETPSVGAPAPDGGVEEAIESERDPVDPVGPPPPVSFPKRHAQVGSRPGRAADAPPGSPPASRRRPEPLLAGEDPNDRRRRWSSELGVSSLVMSGKSGVAAEIGAAYAWLGLVVEAGGLVSWTRVDRADGAWLGPYYSFGLVGTPISARRFEAQIGLVGNLFHLTAVPTDPLYGGLAGAIGGRYYVTDHVGVFMRLDAFVWQSPGLELTRAPLLARLGIAWTAWEAPPMAKGAKP